MKKIRNILISIIALLYIILEDIAWNRIAEPLYIKVKDNTYYESFLNTIASMNRYVILVAFILFFGGEQVLGIIALGAIGKGMVLIGVILYIVKMLPVIIAFAILERGKDKLFTFNWFKKTYEFITHIILKLKQSTAYLTVMDNINSIKLYFKSKKDSILKKLFIHEVKKHKQTL
jgi:hypothetical protein